MIKLLLVGDGVIARVRDEEIRGVCLNCQLIQALSIPAVLTYGTHAIACLIQN